MHPASANRSSTAWVVALTGLGSLMAALDTLVVATALGTIRLDLGASIEQLEWTVNAYNLSFAVLLIPAAALGDRFGRRSAYAAGLTLFATASAACALAPTIGWLIAARTAQGAGAALLMPLALTLLSAAFPPERRGTAIGIFSAITGLAVATGPLVGGAVVEGIAWQWIFWLNVPIGLAAALLTLVRVPESRGYDAGLDAPGLVLVAGGALGLVWALVRGNAVGWGSTEVLAALAAGCALLAAFVAWERRAPSPMLPLAMFRSRAFSAGNVASFCTFGSLFALVFFFAQLMQVVLGYGPLAAGLRLMAWTATFITVAPLAGTLADRFGERPFIVGGLGLQAAGVAWLAATVSTQTTYGGLIGPFVVAGVGISMAIPGVQTSVMAAAAADRVGKAAGANSMMRELGGVFGIALAVAAFAGAGGYASAATFVDGFVPALAVSAGLALAGAVSALALPGRRAAPAAEPVGVVPVLEKEASAS